MKSLRLNILTLVVAGYAQGATNVIIQSSSPDIDGNGTVGDDITGNLTAASSGFVTSIVTGTAVQNLLATSNLSIAAMRNITQNAALSWVSGRSLSYTATDPTGSVIFNSSISAGNGQLIVSAPGSITVNGSIMASLDSYFEGNSMTISTNTLSFTAGTTPLVNGAFFDILRANTIAFTNPGGPPSLNLPALSSGLSWDTSEWVSSGNLRIIPEPSSILLGLLGFTALFRRSRYSVSGSDCN